MMAETHDELVEHLNTEIDALRTELTAIKQQQSFEEKFYQMELRNVEREERRNAAKRGTPGPQGQRGARGEPGRQGARGKAGRPATEHQLVGWKVDASQMRAVPFFSNGKPGPAIDLMPIADRIANEVEGRLQSDLQEAVAKVRSQF